MNLPKRPRRLRQSPLWRDMVADSQLRPEHLMLPHFILDGQKSRVAIDSMPGIQRQSVDVLLRQLETDLALGIRQIMLFGIEATKKDRVGSSAGAADGLVPRAVRAIKAAFGADLLVGTDVCLCAYTDHGHCGILAETGKVDNDGSLPHLAAMALAHAAAGADLVAPSDMMDGRVCYLRDALDTAGFTDTAILAYSAKYASAYYGPFREAAGSAPRGDRKTYQMDYRNSREALREVQLDIAEGADLVMVKPALAYLDIVSQVRLHTRLPVACYNVSGEYAMVKAAAARGWVDEAAVVRENLFAMRRAGADIILSYHARAALQGAWL